MDIQVNGKTRPMPEGATLAALLDELGLAGQELVIEHGGEIVPTDADPAAHALTEGDRLEIVRFVGGG